MKRSQLMNKSSETPTNSLQRQKVGTLSERFGCRSEFMEKVNPTTQAAFLRRPELSVTGDYPTLRALNDEYGASFAEQWLLPQIADLSLFTGAKNLDKRKQMELAQTMAAEYYYLKVTEFLLFFARFKSGRYGRFYGAVDPMVITCALREFVSERNDIIARTEQERREREEREYREAHPPISYDEYLRRKEATQ